MLRIKNSMFFGLVFSLLVIVTLDTKGQFVPVGNGGYTETFPGTDAAGRNGFPPGQPQLSGNVVGKPVPTNDWWSLLLQSDHVSNLFNYPMAMKTIPAGLVVSYIPWGVFDDQEPIVVGLSGLSASRATVADYTDWTVTFDWTSGARNLQVTSGIAMPFLYFKKSTDDLLQITVNLGNVSIQNELLIIENARNGADFVFYAPTGSTWIQNGKVYSSTLNGKDYWSMAMLPLTTTNVSQTAELYKEYAYVFPKNTLTKWSFDENTSKVRTDFTIEADVKEGTANAPLIGLLPHQWANLSSDSPRPDLLSYSSVRGEIKTMAATSFSVENTYLGILPTLPYQANYSEGFSIAELDSKVKRLENDGLSTWTDSYNEGQVMNRLIQTARIAHEMGNFESRDKMLATIKERLEDWLTAKPGQVAFLFYYNKTWSAMLGYPAGHGQDSNLNDHHFHWGYFIHAAAFLEQFEPGWAEGWGEMVNLLVRDAASPDRDDDMFPFLRNFSPYAGHCWANGFASFPQGNDQESTSESMQFNSALIHWGTITGNKEIRDLGIYLYTTEQTAIEEYWFDMYERNFGPNQQYSLVSRVWGNSYDNGTFWTDDIAASYGIELYPIHGGSLYLGHHQDYATKLWREIEQNTGILRNEANVNLWHDVKWQYLAFTDPQKAIDLYDSYPERELKFGVSDAQTYYWLHVMNAMGIVDVSVTADYPTASVFINDGKRTYVANNYEKTAITVTFSDGFELEVPARTMVSSNDVDIESELTSSFTQAYVNGSVDLSLIITKGEPTKVEFFRGSEMIGEMTEGPFDFKAMSLPLGVHDFYAKVFEGEKLAVSNIVTVTVGEQVPYMGTPWAIPGTIEAAHYDVFEGGRGQGITYSDVSMSNEGDFRKEEGVDAIVVAGEGATVGWIVSGEWLEYTVNVEKAGLYSMEFRYASGNSSGGGPFWLEMNGKKITDDIRVESTQDWDAWSSQKVENIPLIGGENILRLAFGNGEMNIGRMTFSFEGESPFSQPTADAGSNIVVILPAQSTLLTGTGTDPEGGNLVYHWLQVYGPNRATIADPTAAVTMIEDLVEGIYNFELTVSNGEYQAKKQLLVIVSSDGIIAPIVAINTPSNNQTFLGGRPIQISAIAKDLDGSIEEVEFYAGDEAIGKATQEPWSISWTGEVGSYVLSATAKDNDGNTASSSPVNVRFTEAPSCSGIAENGDFRFEFSDDLNNPTITFIPNVPGMGDQTLILYYGTQANGNFPGYGVRPNQPFRLNAPEGTTVWFYYTYSHPTQGEKNTAGQRISYVVGTCQGTGEGGGGEDPTGPGIDFPITFEENLMWPTLITNFDGGDLTVIDNPHQDGNTSAKVARMVKGAGQLWGGSFLTKATPIDFSKGTDFKVSVRAPRAGTKMLLKFENEFDGGQFYEQELLIPEANKWVELTFDMSGRNPSLVFKKIVLIFELGTVGDGSSSFTWYVDNIRQGDQGENPGVEKMNQVITFEPIITQIIGDVPFDLYARADSDLPVSFQADSDHISIAGNTVTIIKAGRATVLALQEGNESYHPALPVSQSFCINPAKPTISLDGLGSGMVTLTSSAAVGNQWYLNGQIIAGATNQSYEASVDGVFSVATRVDDCMSAISDPITLIVNSLDREVTAPITFYPNPSENHFFIKGVLEPIRSLELSDMVGRIHTMSAEDMEGLLKIDISHLPAGVYMLRMIHGNTQTIHKILKK
ncbi:glycosyl hydrolase [Belliella kenyensis]|uniref:glucan endo-1,3-beta-D-glucosidase n=1 Tax=Belliella kenyensis TaxID=1472724 RepID=A0ABV8EQP1_9BACT|nr:glycosyl hydrolase [Belliella kenyensis]MCH7402922.1 glycosyl hydrolase [Belliella kenyensis]MDN3602628.1 glycosyl hydrolase [Belliella kenyensis]